MLTVKEINEVSFGKAGFSGYKPEDVDNFIDEVASSFQQLQAERDDALKQADDLAQKNQELAEKYAESQKKLAILAQKIEAYREEEDGIKDALLSAQKLAKNSVQEAKNKAEVILEDAKETAKQTMENAKTEAAQAAQEYMRQAESKKAELEEMKRQVSAFRSSLMEMYKKHLECIDHIPVFYQKEAAAPVQEEKPREEKAQEKAEPPVKEPAVSEEAPATAAPQREEPSQEPEQAPAKHSAPAEPAQSVAPSHRAVPPAKEKHGRAPTLHDKVNYTREQIQFEDSPEEDDDDRDLSGVGIDLNAYSNIPESLQREKDSHFSNLEFGDNVDLGRSKKHKK